MKTKLIRAGSACGDYYANIFNAICDKDDFLTKVDILAISDDAGIASDGPRTTKLRAEINKLTVINKIDS